MNPSPTCRHLHTDGRPCGSPALRGEPFCFHHHTARKPMPKRVDPTDPRILLTPQLPAPDDFLAIQRAIGEVLRLLGNDRLPESRALALLKGLAIASQNLARHHRREEKLAAQGLLPELVTAYVNDPKYGTIALNPDSPVESEAPATENLPQTTDNAALPDPIPVLTPDPSPTTSYDEGKTIEINAYFQSIFDRRAERFEARKEAELEARYELRYTEREAELTARHAQQQHELETQPASRPIPIPIQQNQDLSLNYKNTLAMAS